MKRYSAYLIDLDGTIFRGNQVIKEAPEFIAWLQSNRIPYMFLTNNSSSTPQQVATKLTAMGVSCTENQVYTTGMATAEYIISKESGRQVYAIGEEGLIHALLEKGCMLTEVNPKYVVVGIDREINYEKLTKASLAIQQGAVFLSTNSDRAIPTDKGLVPGNGAITAAISVASGANPKYIGKPESLFVHFALKKLKIAPNQALLVGDNLYTDIMAGINAGVDTLLVYTGITSPEDQMREAIHPTFAVNNLAEWMNKR